MTVNKKNGKKSAAQKPAIKVGDIAQFQFGSGFVRGRVIEDRGKIGFRGRNLYRIVVPMEEQEPMYIELPPEEFTIYRRASIAKKPPVAKKTGTPRVAKAKTIRVKPQPKKEANGG